MIITKLSTSESSLSAVSKRHLASEYSLNVNFAAFFKIYTIVLMQFQEFCINIIQLLFFKCSLLGEKRMAETSLNYFNFRRQIVDDSLEFRRNPRIREINRKKEKKKRNKRD